MTQNSARTCRDVWQDFGKSDRTKPKTLQTPGWWLLPMTAAGLVAWVLIFDLIGVL